MQTSAKYIIMMKYKYSFIFCITCKNLRLYWLLCKLFLYFCSCCTFSELSTSCILLIFKTLPI